MNFENPQTKKEKENNYELIIENKVWSLIQQRLDIDTPNPRSIKIIFNSSHPKVNEKSKLEDENFNPKENIIVQGVFDYATGEMHFNVAPDEINKKLMAELITHELIHYAQMQSEKYERMKPPFDNDPDLPWEREAYRLMKPIAKELIKNLDDCLI